MTEQPAHKGYDNLVCQPGAMAYHCRACSAVILNVTLHEWCCPGRTEEFKRQKMLEDYATVFPGLKEESSTTEPSSS